jgi:hypothetical protein
MNSGHMAVPAIITEGAEAEGRAFVATGMPISIDSASEQHYKRHTGGSQYPVTFKARHCWLGLDSGSTPGMTRFIVFSVFRPDQ